jgi:hypothetical protein
MQKIKANVKDKWKLQTPPLTPPLEGRGVKSLPSGRFGGGYYLNKKYKTLCVE